MAVGNGRPTLPMGEDTTVAPGPLSVSGTFCGAGADTGRRTGEVLQALEPTVRGCAWPAREEARVGRVSGAKVRGNFGHAYEI